MKANKFREEFLKAIPDNYSDLTKEQRREAKYNFLDKVYHLTRSASKKESFTDSENNKWVVSYNN